MDPRAQGGGAARPGPTEGPFIRGSGEGVGVHLLTGPIGIENPNPATCWKSASWTFGRAPAVTPATPAAASAPTPRQLGFHYHDLIEEPKPREVITIFELDTSGEPFARAVYNYVWTPQTDPDSIVHATIDYPGVRVDHATIRKRENILAM